MSTTTELQPYVDGWLGDERELTVIPRPQFPFLRNPTPDTYSRLYDRDYEVHPKLFIPKAANRTAWSNRLTYSEDFDNAAWTKTNLTVTANAGTAADGQTTLDKLLETTATAEHSVTQAATVTAAPTEVSVFAVGGLTRTFIRLAFIDSASTVFSAYFNIVSGYAITPAANTTAKIVALGGGHFRCVLQFTPAAGAGTFKVNVSTDGSTISFAGSTSAGVHLWGAQVTTGVESPYISTTAAARAISAPDRDRTDPFAYLLTEDDPVIETSQTAKVHRLFGRIPLPQTVPATRMVTKPELTGEFPRVVFGILIDQPDPEIPVYTFYSQTAVTSDPGPPAPGFTAGDFDVTIGGDTASSIAFNASNGAIQTALNALPSVTARNTITVTGALPSVHLAMGLWPVATADVSGITYTGAAPTASPVTSDGPYIPPVWHVQIVSNHMTGGDFTLTILGETTAPIPIDGTKSDYEDAINALSVIGGGAFITIPSRSFGYSGKPLDASQSDITFTIYIPFPAASGDGTGLTPSGTVRMDRVYDGWQLSLAAGSPTPRVITAPSHGITTSDDIIVTAGGINGTLAAGLFTVPTANTISFTNTAGWIYYYSGAITFVGVATGKTYESGTVEVRVKLITRFYLPGVTPGISTSDDIPIPINQGSDTAIVSAIFNGLTEINYATGEQGQWRDTPIETRTLTTLNPQEL